MSYRVDVFCSDDEGEVQERYENNKKEYDTVSIAQHEGSACTIAEDEEDY